MDKTFTIIIPCYNSEKYIEKCLDSLLNQNYDINLLQILVINDGSTNNLLDKIIYNYKKKFSIIEYYKKKNGNWGSVINYVLENKLAKNDYVSILDSDDFLNLNAFKNINSQISNIDLFIGSFRYWNGNIPTIYLPPYFFIWKKSFDNKRVMNTPFCLPLIYFCKKEVFYKLNKLKENIPYQDFDYSSQIIFHSKKMIFSKKVVGYYYISREGNSFSAPWNIQRLNIEYEICNSLLEKDLQELISFRLNVKQFRKFLKKENKKFIINRKFEFTWFPFWLRIFYLILFYFTQINFFIYKNNE